MCVPPERERKMSVGDREDRLEWAAWLALDEKDRRRLLGYAKGEVDVDGWTDARLLAGKALHGQPFGFTWDDVDALRATAAVFGGGGAGPTLSSLADRITALLPPREP